MLVHYYLHAIRHTSTHNAQSPRCFASFNSYEASKIYFYIISYLNVKLKIDKLAYILK